MRPEHWLLTIPLRLRSLFRRAQGDRELDDELRDHLERKTEVYVARGMTQEEAHRRARLDLEGIEQTKEKCRDARRVNWIQDFVQDLHFGLRMLRKTPGFTNVVILTLALGIQGVNIEVKQRGKLVWRRGWDYTQRNLLLGRVGMRFFDTATYCIPRIYFEPSQALINKAFAATPKSRKNAKVVARR